MLLYPDINNNRYINKTDRSHYFSQGALITIGVLDGGVLEDIVHATRRCEKSSPAPGRFIMFIS